MDQSSMNPRKNLAATVADNYTNNGGWVMHGSSSSSVPAGNGLGLFGSRPPPPPPPPPPLYSTLPSFSITPPLSHQPPLLPLPFSKSATLPSPSKRVTATDVRPRQHKQKPRPSAGSRKETRSPSTARSEPKPAHKTQEEEGKDEDFLLGTSLYSISPPPSSLPIPRFSLTRPKGVSESTTASCNVQAAGGAGGGGGVRAVDAGASDNLRRLLRL